ncbi:hypothetical protein BBJ28_00002301 [Nothophytophthora sp. Chile5]|nr:hypothetical protein BBJ28_00002301 [Nothophytophthora sp. Chile5]
MQHRGSGRPKSRAAILASARRASLRDLQSEDGVAWVALCGTVFDVTDDPFFDARRGAIYGSWVGHDVTFLLLQLSLTLDAADDAVSVASYLDREWPLEALKFDEKDDTAAKRCHGLLEEWYVRFHSRYAVVAQLSDRYVGAQWDALRYELLPSDSSSSSGGKCPLGFGAKKLDHVVSRARSDSSELRTITFQGRRYDVTDSSLFNPNDGQFAHFVGHDVTYALAVQSTRPEDLDVQPDRAYTFQEQVMLEKYRVAFARELAVLEVDQPANQQQVGSETQTEVVNLHAIIEQSDDITPEASVQRLEQALKDATAEQVDAVCVRTTMTPLHKAVEKRRLDLVTLLVRAGADIAARAALYDGETPLEMARRFHYDEIAAHLASDVAGNN